MSAPYLKREQLKKDKTLAITFFQPKDNKSEQNRQWHNKTKEMEDYKFLFKVVLVGNAGVGKTCLVRRFTQGMFPPGQGATIGVDFMIKTVEIEGEKIKVRLIQNYLKKLSQILVRNGSNSDEI